MSQQELPQEIWVNVLDQIQAYPEPSRYRTLDGAFRSGFFTKKTMKEECLDRMRMGSSLILTRSVLDELTPPTTENPPSSEVEDMVDIDGLTRYAYARTWDSDSKLNSELVPSENGIEAWKIWRDRTLCNRIEHITIPDFSVEHDPRWDRLRRPTTMGGRRMLRRFPNLQSLMILGSPDDPYEMYSFARLIPSGKPFSICLDLPPHKFDPRDPDSSNIHPSLMFVKRSVRRANQTGTDLTVNLHMPAEDIFPIYAFPYDCQSEKYRIFYTKCKTQDGWGVSKQAASIRGFSRHHSKPHWVFIDATKGLADRAGRFADIPIEERLKSAVFETPMSNGEVYLTDHGKVAESRVKVTSSLDGSARPCDVCGTFEGPSTVYTRDGEYRD